jgi:hypothetical protein
MFTNKIHLCALCAVLFLSGGLSLRVAAQAAALEVEPGTAGLELPGLASAYVSMNGMGDGDRGIFSAVLFRNLGRGGEIVSVDFWPIVGFGIGFVGARVHVLPVEVGLGVLFYPHEPAAPRERVIEEKKVIIEHDSE